MSTVFTEVDPSESLADEKLPVLHILLSMARNSAEMNSPASVSFHSVSHLYHIFLFKLLYLFDQEVMLELVRFIALVVILFHQLLLVTEMVNRIVP